MNSDNMKNKITKETIEDSLKILDIEKEFIDKFDINTSEIDIDIEETEKAEKQFNELYENSKQIKKVVNESKNLNDRFVKLQIETFKEFKKHSEITKDLLNEILKEIKEKDEITNKELKVLRKIILKQEELNLKETENRTKDKKSIVITIIIFSFLSSIISSALIISFFKFFN